VKLDIAIQPENEEEVEFLDQLTEARTYAIEETSLSEAEIAAVFSQFSSGLCTEHTPAERHGEVECPTCGEPVKAVDAPAMGSDPTCKPCGHEVEWADLPADVTDLYD
jgi:formylmethanofuran dehydrogenase subunit E